MLKRDFNLGREQGERGESGGRRCLSRRCLEQRIKQKKTIPMLGCGPGHFHGVFEAATPIRELESLEVFDHAFFARFTRKNIQIITTDHRPRTQFHRKKPLARNPYRSPYPSLIPSNACRHASSKSRIYVQRKYVEETEEGGGM
jgi:hypothetical protein